MAPYLSNAHTTVGKRNYFTGYGILLHELPVVAILFIQSNNNERTNLHVVKYGIYTVK